MTKFVTAKNVPPTESKNLFFDRVFKKINKFEMLTACSPVSPIVGTLIADKTIRDAKKRNQKWTKIC
jgi:hypothetical protein